MKRAGWFRGASILMSDESARPNRSEALRHRADPAEEGGSTPLTDVDGNRADIAWTMVDASPDALVMVNESGVIQLVNRQAEALLGYDRGELLGLPVEVVLPEHLAAVHRAHRTRYRAAPEVRAMGSGLELVARRRDGLQVPVEISLSPFHINRELHIIAAIRDVTERKRLEVEASRVRGALDAIADGVYLFDPDTWRFVYVNGGAVAQSGYDCEELVGEMTPLHLAPELTRLTFGEMVARVVTGETRQLLAETTMLHRLGRQFPVEFSLECPASQPGHRLLSAVVRDISARRAEERRTRLVQHSIDAVSDAVFMCDEQTLEFTYVNQGAVDLHEYSYEELLGGMGPGDLAPNLDPAELRSALDYLEDAPGEGVRLRTDGERKDGTLVPVDVEINWPAPTHPGDPRPVMAVVRDMTDHVEQERALTASEARFRAAFGEGPTPMAIVDVRADGERTMVDVNEALADLFGYARSEILGRSVDDLIVDDDERPQASVASPTTPGRVANPDGLVRGVCADGAGIWLRRHSSALDPEGGSTHQIVHIVDVTAEIEAEIARRRQEDLTAALSSVRLRMLQGGSRAAGLALLCEAAAELLRGPGALILTPSGDHGELRIEACVGVPTRIRERLSFTTTTGAVGDLFSSGRATYLNTGRHPATPEETRAVLDEQGVGPILLAPLPGADGVAGVLIVVRLDDAAHFTDADLDPAQQLASGAVNAIDLAESRAKESLLRILEDRDRIGRDIHDKVISRLFGTGMNLQAVLTLDHDRGAVADRIGGAVEDIDQAIKDIRSAIYGVRSLADWGRGVRGEILAVAAEHDRAFGFEPTVTLEGPIDSLPSDVTDDVLAVVREALTNAAKYANASSVCVEVVCTATEVDVRIIDDGPGLDQSEAATPLSGKGLGNLSARAEAHGGSIRLTSDPGSGTTVLWHVPL